MNIQEKKGNYFAYQETICIEQICQTVAVVFLDNMPADAVELI